MRIKVKGRIELKEIHQVGEKVFEYLSRYGITETRDITFYLTILDPPLYSNGEILVAKEKLSAETLYE
jgi:hypothetical protein